MKRVVPLLLASCLAAVSTAASGAVFIEHTGANDPTTEGWTANDGGGGVTGTAVINDLGTTDAWAIDDNSTAAGTTLFYTYVPSGAELTDADTNGWSLTTTLRVLDDMIFGSSPGVAFGDNTRTYLLSFAVTAGGDPVVRLANDLFATTGADYTLTGLSSTYNTFSLRFDPMAGSADLFVNGVEVISNYTGIAFVLPRVFFGAGSSADVGQANFASVQFATNAVPEPATFLGALAAIGLVSAGRTRKRRFRTRGLKVVPAPSPTLTRQTY